MGFLIFCFHFYFVYLGRVENTSQNLSNNIIKIFFKKLKAENKEMSNFGP
jgi:hypothetical protein